MAKRAHFFTKHSQYGAGNIKDDLQYPSFPPFTDTELNTTDDNDLLTILVDSEGRVYTKVRYVETAVDGAIGRLVSFAKPFSAIASGSEPTFNSYSSTTGKAKLNDSTTTYTKNQLKGALLEISGSTDNPYGIVREIYENDATSAGAVEVKIAEKLQTYKLYNAPFDGNALGGTGKKANPTAGTKAGIFRKLSDVVLAGTGALSTIAPVGVLLGDVTKSGENTYCTWIQIYGLGLVYVSTDATNAVNYMDALYSSSTAGTAIGTGVALSSDSAGASIARIVGYALQEVPVSTTRLIPAFICPTLRIPIF